MTGFPAFVVHSRANPRALSTVERNDPYWSESWVSGSQAVWSPAGNPRGGTGLTRDDALRLFSDVRRRATALRLLACLDAWGTVTAEQAAVLTGDTALLDRRTMVPRALETLDLLEMGTYANRQLRRGSTRPVWLYRRKPFGGRALAGLAKELTDGEARAVTGGLPWSTGTSFDRHNVLAVELAIRAAEYLPVSAVLGEKCGQANMLAAQPTGAYTHRADALIIRHDGLRIAIEVTASRSARFDAKVARWVRFMEREPLATTGLVVLFVGVPHPGDIRKRGGSTEIRQAIRKALRVHPERTRFSPAGRIGVADWAKWFPAGNNLSDAFLNLEASFQVGRGSVPAERWLSVPLANISFDPADSFDPLALVRTAHGLLHVPHWLRPA
ncbi:hypothetical protein [Arthrobacter sp. KK5.5]|uniref:hypothetical protein n=1 Tax=Arthrobacter sp. KK5.5 TaxID=3373084 RepID=UPI003EE77056